MRKPAAAVVCLLALAACADQGTEAGGDGATSGGELVAQVASYDLAVESPARLLIGVGTGENLFVSGSTVEVEVSFLGEERAGGEPEPVGTFTAAFLPLPGEDAEHEGEHPEAVPGSEARGVYVIQDLEFERPGFYEAEVTADLGGGDVRTGTGAFQVFPEHRYPAVGDRAPRSTNLTVHDEDAAPEAIDSRAATEGEIPDPELHETTIARAIKQKRPTVVVLATPVYCQSRFCGPVTDMVAELQEEYGDRAEFVHVEIWNDFQEGAINRSAADWVYRDDDLLEPWVYLIGADGRIEARWDNVATRGEIEPFLQDLPAG